MKLSTAAIADTRKGFLFTLGATLLFSIKGLLIKYAYILGASPIAIITLRMGISLPIYLAVLFWMKRRIRIHAVTARDIASMLFIGVIGYYLASYIDLWALTFIDASVERIIIFSYPAFTLLFSVLFFGKRTSATEIGCLSLCYVGIIATCLEQIGHDSEFLKGASLALISAVLFAGYVAVSGTYIKKVGAIYFTCIAMTGASVAVLIQALAISSQNDFDLPLEAYLLCAGIALFSTVLPSFMLSSGIKHIGGTKAAIVSSLGPVITYSLAALCLAESLTAVQFMGMALVIGGVTLLGVRGVKEAP